MNRFLTSLLLVANTLFVACSDDEPKDQTKEITMSISAETGVITGFLATPIEGMLVMTDDEPGKWYTISFQAVSGFTYEKGHEYELRVKRTIIANPPADGSNRRYELVRIVSDKVVFEPEQPSEQEVSSENEIELYDGCPIDKYAVSPKYFVDAQGTIVYGNGDSAPSYDSARIWLEFILSTSDPDFNKYQKVGYMAVYSYVVSPLCDKIRLVRNDSHGPMFKDVIPENEFNHITQSMQPGEELEYALILANVHKKALQKVKFSIIKK